MKESPFFRLFTVMILIILLVLNLDFNSVSTIWSTGYTQERDPVKEQLFKDVQDAFERARSERIAYLSPDNFARANELYHEALEDYNKGERLRQIQEKIDQTMEYLEAAFQRAEISRVILEDAMRLRTEASEMGDRYAGAFSKVDRKFNDVVLEVEEGNINRAESEAKNVEREYRTTAIELLLSVDLKEAWGELEEVRGNIPPEFSETIADELKETENVILDKEGTTFSIENLHRVVMDRIGRALGKATPQLPSLPDSLVIGGFRLSVLEYGPMNRFKLSGRASGRFITFPCAPAQSGSSSSGMYQLIPPILTPFTVEFSGLDIQNWPPKNTENVIAGNINARFEEPLRCPVRDFEVLIDELVLTPNTAEARIRIALPPSTLSKANRCSPVEIGPLFVSIDNACGIQAALPEYQADSLLIGNTGILINLRGVEIDFKSALKKIAFNAGQTITQEPFPSNTGYLYASYRCANAQIIECQGFQASLKLRSPWTFNSIIPLNFQLNLDSGEIEIERNWVRKGTFGGSVTLPQSVKNSIGKVIEVDLVSATVDSLLNLSGQVYLKPGQDLSWGGFTLETDSARLFLPAMYNEFAFSPLDTTSSAIYKQLHGFKLRPVLATLPGLTIDLFEPGPRDLFKILSPDCNQPISFKMKEKIIRGWLNVGGSGIRGELQSQEESKIMDVNYGIATDPDYMGGKPFKASIWHQPDSLLWVDFQFVRNAAFDSYIGGRLNIPYPCEIVPKYKNLEVSSTAELVGGDVFFKEKELAYWGVTMTADSSGNVLSVDQGKIIYMNSWIREKIHFTKPFRIIWGEMLADGGLGKFLFDHNSAGQRFDGFPFTLHRAALSKYEHGKPKTGTLLGYLDAYGDVHFDFFGAKRMRVLDYKDTRSGHGPQDSPFYGRFVKIDKKKSKTGFYKNWGSGTAKFSFTVDYDEIDQNGFQGITTKQPMLVDMQFIPSFNAGKLTPRTIDLNSQNSFIHFCCGSGIENDSQVLKLMKADFASVNTVSGLIQIRGDAVKRIVLEGQAAIKAWKFEGHALANLEITPNNIILRNRAQTSFSCYSVGMIGLASTKLILNKKIGSLEGDVSGVFQVYAGINPVAYQKSYTELEARGRFNFYFGPDANYLQGYGKIRAKFIITLECEGAFFVGYNAPTSKIWALDQISRGPSIREILKNQGKTKLTGIYLAGSFSYTVNLIEIIEGRYSIWVGIGFFGPNLIDSEPDMSTTLLAHAGMGFQGSILGGLARASAWAELLASSTVPPNPLKWKMCLQGTLGVEACVIWICKNWQGTIHVDDSGVGTGGCYK
jgi:hypothetical protein